MTWTNTNASDRSISFYFIITVLKSFDKCDVLSFGKSSFDGVCLSSSSKAGLSRRVATCSGGYND